MAQIIAVYSVKVTVRQDEANGIEAQIQKAPKLDVIEKAIEAALEEQLPGLTANAEAERVD
jgi:hypothetical protein